MPGQSQRVIGLYSAGGGMAYWRSGSAFAALVSIDAVTLRRPRLILVWVTVCGWYNQPRGQLSL